MNTSEVELAVARFFNPRVNIIVPNISWGLWSASYEMDLLIVSPERYCTEVEIKVSESDIKAEKNKHHCHRNEHIRRFFYAVPDYLSNCEYLPIDCGLISINSKYNGTRAEKECQILRPPRINKNAEKLTDTEINKLLHLGCMRIWSLKEKTIHQNKNNY